MGHENLFLQPNNDNIMIVSMAIMIIIMAEKALVSTDLVRESILWQLTGVEEKVRPRSRNSGFEELAAGWGWPQCSRCCSKPGLQWLFVCFRFQCAEVPRCTACVDLLHLPFLLEFRFVLEYHPWGKHTATCNAAWSCNFFHHFLAMLLHQRPWNCAGQDAEGREEQREQEFEDQPAVPNS